MSVIMFNSFICLSLLCHCVLNVEISRDSAEDSDESLESLEINKVKETSPGATKCLAIAEKIRSDSCLVEVCSASCPGSLDSRQEVTRHTVSTLEVNKETSRFTLMSVSII